MGRQCRVATVIFYLELPVRGLQQLFGLVSGASGGQHELVDHHLFAQRVHGGRLSSVHPATRTNKIRTIFGVSLTRPSRVSAVTAAATPVRPSARATIILQYRFVNYYNTDTRVWLLTERAAGTMRLGNRTVCHTDIVGERHDQARLFTVAPIGRRLLRLIIYYVVIITFAPRRKKKIITKRR